ncbi:MAG: glycosyltransferase [Butyrivibrio sp.]|nr:glycosyltransferase [Butyrivibrio sp.]
MEKKVSIIIPAYNAEKYIEKCIISACSQTYENLEIIVVDDGSGDGSLEIAQDLSKKDERVTVIHKENGGVSSARNVGFSASTGYFITFLDSDDELTKDAVSIMVRAMEISASDLVSCNFLRFDEKGNVLDDFDLWTGERDISLDTGKMSFITHELLQYHVGYEVFAKLFKADIIKQNDISFPADCRIGEDLAFNIKYLMNCHSITCLSDRIYRYLIREGSAMDVSKGLSVRLSERLKVLRDVLSYGEGREKSYITDKASLISGAALDSIYVGSTPMQVLEALDKPSDKEFMKDIYRSFTDSKDDFKSLYPGEIAGMKYRYHMYLRGKLCGENLWQKLSGHTFDLYRKVKKREPVATWKMPY